MEEDVANKTLIHLRKNLMNSVVSLVEDFNLLALTKSASHHLGQHPKAGTDQIPTSVHARIA